MKRRIRKAVFVVVSCGLIVQAAFPIHTANAQVLVKQEHSIENTRKEIVYLSNVRMEEVPAELLEDDEPVEDFTEDLEEDPAGSIRAAAEEWRITSAADWEALMSGGKSPAWSDGSYTGSNDVMIILEADIVTDRTSICFTQENIALTLDLNGHSFQSSAGILNVNSTDATGGKRIVNSFVLCNGKIVNTCIDTASAMEKVDIHGVDFIDMNTNAVSGNFSSSYTIHDCSFLHAGGENTHTAIEVHSSGMAGQAVQIYNNVINGFQNGVNGSRNSNGVVLDNITVANAYLGINLSDSVGSRIVSSVLSGNQAAGSQGVLCNGAGSSISLNDFLYNNQSDMSQVTISDFDRGVCNTSVNNYSLDNCIITRVNYGLDAGNGSAQFYVRDSILSASPSVAEGSYAGDSYGIYAQSGYQCVNTEVTGFKIGAINNGNTAVIANCTFDNLDCNVNAYCGGVYNSTLKNAVVGFYNNNTGNSTACIIDTVISGRNESGSIGIHEPIRSSAMYVLSTTVFPPDGLHRNLDDLITYVRSAYPDAPHNAMCVSGYAAGLQCDGSQIQIADIEVKNCGTGIKGTVYEGYRKAGVNGIPNNYIHDCDYGVDCNRLALNSSNLYIYNCNQTGMQIHDQLTGPRLVEIYSCRDGLVLDGTTITGPHLQIHDNTGNGLVYNGSSSTSMIRATMEIYNNGGWNICGDDINMFHLAYDSNQEFTCRLENGGIGNMNIKPRGNSGSNFMLNVSCLKSDESVYYVYPGKELCINPQGDSTWTGPTDWLQGSMVFDTEEANYTEGAVAAYIPDVYVRTIPDQQEGTWNFVRTHFGALKEGWVIRYDSNASPGATGGQPLVFMEGCNVTYDYETNGGTRIQSDYEKITYLEGEAVDLSITAERPGYEFLGWSTSPDAHVPLSVLTAGRKNITLYAVYRKAVTFTYHTYDSSLDYTQDGYIFNQETAPYADPGGSRALNALSYSEQVPESYYVYAGYSFDGKDKTNLFQDGPIPSVGQTDIYCVYIMNGVLSYLRPDGAVDHQQTVEAFYTILDTLPYQFSYVLHSFRPEKGYVFRGWRDDAGGLYAPGSTYATTRNPAELQAEVTQLLISSLAVSPKHSTISIGETLRMQAVIQPEDAWNPTVTWTTSDAAIASIDANGLVTAHGEGTVTITATANDGSGCFDTATVVVVKKESGPSSQPRTGDGFPMKAALLLGCLSLLITILSIFNLGKKRGAGN